MLGCLLVVLLTTSCAGREAETITVAPGGSAVGLDGIMLDARHAGLEGPVTITLERVDDEVGDLLPLTQGLTPLTGYYRIGHPDVFVTPEGEMIIAVPLPEGAPPENLGVSIFVPAGSDIHGELPDLWSTGIATYVPSIDRVAFTSSVFMPEGLVFVIVSRHHPGTRFPAIDTDGR